MRKDKRHKRAHKHPEIGVVLPPRAQQLPGDGFLGGQTLTACRLSTGGNHLGQRFWVEGAEARTGLWGEQEEQRDGACSEDAEQQSPEAREAKRLAGHRLQRCGCCWLCSSAGCFAEAI